MFAAKPVIGETDAQHLHEMIAESWVQLIADQHVLCMLKEYLNEATVVPDKTLSTTVVRMHSIVSLRFADPIHTDKFQLVYPKDANILSARLSVLSPIGVSIVGRERGESISAQLTTGARQVTITDVTQTDTMSAAAFHSSLLRTRDLLPLSIDDAD